MPELMDQYQEARARYLQAVEDLNGWRFQHWKDEHAVAMIDAAAELEEAVLEGRNAEARKAMKRRLLGESLEWIDAVEKADASGGEVRTHDALVRVARKDMDVAIAMMGQPDD